MELRNTAATRRSSAIKKKEKMSSNKTQHLVKFFLPVVFVIISIIFVKMDAYALVSGADFNFHNARLLGLINSMKHGDLFPNINYVMANGLGYGTPMFYGQWFLYFPALLVVIFGATMFHAWLVLYMIFYSTFLTVNFYVGKKFGLKGNRALLSTLLLTFNPLTTSIVNGYLPFAICLLMLPAFFYYLQQAFFKGKTHIVILALLATLFIHTHILSTIVLGIICVIWLLLNIKYIHIKLVIDLAKTILLTVLLSASFLLPLLEQLHAQDLIATGTRDAFRYGSVQGIGSIFINSLNDDIRSINRFPTLSLVGLILLVLSVFRLPKEDKFQTRILSLIVALIVLGSNLFPWFQFAHSPLGTVQFVGRYLVFAMVFILLISTLNPNISDTILIGCLVITVFVSFTRITFPDMSSTGIAYEQTKKLNTKSYTRAKKARFKEISQIQGYIDGDKTLLGVSGGEYLNEDADPKELSNNGKVSGENVKISNVHKSYGKISFNYQLKKSAGQEHIQVPFLWYKGYKAEYSNGGDGSQPMQYVDSKTDKVTKDGKIFLTVKKSGHVEIEYTGTLLQKFSSIVTLLTAGSLLWQFYVRKKQVIRH